MLGPLIGAAIQATTFGGGWLSVSLEILAESRAVRALAVELGHKEPGSIADTRSHAALQQTAADYAPTPRS